MNNLIFLRKQAFLISFLLMWATQYGYSQSKISFVDPFIGSGGHGHVFVGANVPFGAVQVGPNNFFKGWDWCSGYNYRDSMLIGFSHTHLSGTGIGDLGDVLLMPYTGELKTDKGLEKMPGSGYASRYSHQDEKAGPGFYSVKLLDYDIKVSLTATERVGFHKYQFPSGKQGHIIIDLKEGINDRSTETFIEQVDPYTFKGYRYSSGWAKNQLLFFAIKSSVAVTKFNVYDNDKLLQAVSGKGGAIKGVISFDTTPKLVLLKVGISPVSSDNALANIQAEIPHWDFDKVLKSAQRDWENALSKISVETRSEPDKRVFYTAMYHTMINPALYNDHNGDYRGADKKIYRNANFSNYSVFSLWDTYRAANPLYALIQPERVGDMVNSMLAIHDQQGRLPIWHLMGNETGTMVGISSRQVIAEAYLKGIKGFDPVRAFEAIKATSMIDTLGMKYAKNFQPIPTDKESRSVGKGMEYSIADGSAALMAKKLGKIQDYELFLKRSRNYQLYFDKKDQFFKGILADGNWTPKFTPIRANNNIYAEGNAWQYLWLAPHDIPGLIKLMGGKDRFKSRLDSFFVFETTPEEKGLIDLTGVIGQYAHGNEPGHHIPYLYASIGQQWKTAKLVRKIMTEMYHDKPDGIIGNEDCGQMSAWYVFSALGFYPVYPASGNYMIGSPKFDRAIIRLGKNKTFTVETTNNSADNIYIQRISLNGKDFNSSSISHDQILMGGTMKIVMGAQPNYNFGLQH